jgi:mRNA-degrading endonuclease toxin of MazEF toxin-antitoxin module
MAKEAQINLRLPADLDAWLSRRAGASRRKPAFVRDLLERERAREAEVELQALFDHAHEALPDRARAEVRTEREAWASGQGRARSRGGEPPTALRGEIWEVDLDGGRGRDQGSTRPCLVVSADGLNRSRMGAVIVCPLTMTHREPFSWRPALTPGDLRIADSTWAASPRWVETDQVISLDRAERLVRHLASVTNPEKMQSVDYWLRRLIHPPAAGST